MRWLAAAWQRGDGRRRLAVRATEPAGDRAGSASTRHRPVTTCAVIGEGSTGAAVKTIQTRGRRRPPTATSARPPRRRCATGRRRTRSPATGVVDAATWAALPAATGRAGLRSAGAGHRRHVTCAALSIGATRPRGRGASEDRGHGGRRRLRRGRPRDAVEKVQQAANLTVTGVANAATWKALTLLGSPECSTARRVGPARLRRREGAGEDPQPGQHAGRRAGEAARHDDEPGRAAGDGLREEPDRQALHLGWHRPEGLRLLRAADDGVPARRADHPAHGRRAVRRRRARTSRSTTRKQGDLLFYASDVTKPSTVYHVAMYVGGGQLLDSPQTGENVQIDPLWTTDLLPGRRPPGRQPEAAGEARRDRLDGHPAAAGPEPPRRGADRRRRVRAGDRRGRPGLADRRTSSPPNGVVDVATWLTLK